MASSIIVPSGELLVAQSVGNSAVAAITLANCFTAQYSRYYIVGTGISLGTTAQRLLLTFSNAGGLITTGYNTSACGNVITNGTTTGGGTNVTAGSAHDLTGGISSFTFLTTTDIYFHAEVLRPSDTTSHNLIISDMTAAVASSTIGHCHVVDAVVNGGSAITGFEVTSTSGTLSGSVYVYASV